MDENVLCPLCGINKVTTGKYCSELCQPAIDSGEEWALKLLSLTKQEENEIRRMYRPRPGAKNDKQKGYRMYDPTPEQLAKRKQSDMADVLDQVEGALGIQFPPGFLDLVEQYNPAVERIEEILKSTKTELTREAMIIQFYEIVIDYWKHTPEEFDKHGDGHLFTEWMKKAEKADFVWRSYNVGLQRRGKPAMPLATFKRRLMYARQRLRDYEKKR